MGTVLSFDQYGKAENRVVRIYRDNPRHEIWDLNVSTALRGDFAAAHVEGDQRDVLPTDTQKNTAFVYAKKHGVTSPEDYAIAVGQRLIEASPKASGAQVRVEQYAWDRIDVDGAGHDHAFLRRGGAVRTTVVTLSGRNAEQLVRVVSGLRDLVLLKSTGSEFKGFLRDEYTTLQETDDRILATSLVARWRYAGTEVDWNSTYGAISASLLETFATTYSRALQETLYLMGAHVLKAHEEVAEIRFSAPNKHHFPVDLARFGLENSGEVFTATDRPYGLIEAAVTRDDAPEPGDAWLAVPSFL
ncbi:MULTISPECIES: factor-independent urate hydroxylase [Micromonospora]|uniref:Uricase n=1 Tax=Micromonospora mirobrigensis TaxID=262898 RepID=A0A1C4X1J1_9ACTN|nr:MULTISPECIES: urate oxidase [Micromonospora]WBC16770.1 urate oxidase [Micromonospora sp. WMMA1998]WFE66783.1 urate oxidase [Micromonospora sp. WMMD714]SCF02264.1 urate oxidase [Micromonospora mirobrigensis]